MGNHTKPWEVGEDTGMEPSSYTLSENWGFQVNFMVPLDKRGLEQCRRIAKRQEEKMQLDYELVRALKCAELQRQGFTKTGYTGSSPVSGHRTYTIIVTT